MIVARIYVEGTNDRAFIKSFLEIILGLKVTISGKGKKQIFTFKGNNVKGEILLLKGWRNIRTPFFQNQLIANTEENIKNVLLLDADMPSNDGSFVVRQSEVDAIRTDIDFEYFLIPNHQDDGYLETILRAILVDANKGLLDCIDSNESCLRSATNGLEREINLFPEKGAEKVKFSYLRRLLKDLDNGNFNDSTIWDLNHAYLIPLKEFLSNQLGLSQ